MNILSISGVEYIFPTSWLDVSIGTMQKINALKAKPLEELKYDDDDRTLELAHLLGDVPLDVLYNMEAMGVYKIKNLLSFIDLGYPTETTDEFTYNGITYKFDIDINTFKTWQMFDLDTLYKLGSDHLHTCTAICYKEIGKDNQTSEDVKKRAKIFQDHMPANYALSTMAFMLVLGQIYASSSSVYSVATKLMGNGIDPIQTVKIDEVLKMITEVDGDGQFLCTKLPETILT